MHLKWHCCIRKLLLLCFVNKCLFWFDTVNCNSPNEHFTIVLFSNVKFNFASINLRFLPFFCSYNSFESKTSSASGLTSCLGLGYCRHHFGAYPKKEKRRMGLCKKIEHRLQRKINQIFLGFAFVGNAYLGCSYFKYRSHCSHFSTGPQAF